MKFSLQNASLQPPLEAVVNVVERAGTLPITANVLMVVKSNVLSITSTNLQVEMRCRQSLQLDTPDFQTTLPGRKLADISRSLPQDAELECELTDSAFTVRSGKFFSSLNFMEAENFPLMEETQSENSISIQLDAKTLGALLDRSSYAMAVQDVRFYLNGMLIETRDGSIYGVATDGHRLALSSATENVQVNRNGAFVIPRRGVVELVRVLQNRDGRVDLQAENGNFSCNSNNLQFKCKLIDGEYPNYQSAIPQNPANTLLVNNKTLISTIERILILSNEKPRSLDLCPEPGKLILRTRNAQGERAEDETEAEFNGTPTSIGFNAEYLLSALRKIETEKTSISFNDKTESCLLEEHMGSDMRSVIMPMKT